MKLCSFVGVDINCQILVAVNLFHCARKRRHHRCGLRDRSDDRQPCSEACPLEMPRYLIAHDIGLLQNLLAKRLRAVRRGLVHHHRERGLQRMRQISDMRPRPLDNLPIGLNQCVRFASKRSDLLGEFSGQTLGTARSNGGESIGDAFERGKAETNLECRRKKQDCRKNGKCDDQRLVERARLVRNFSSIARYGDKIVPLVA